MTPQKPPRRQLPLRRPPDVPNAAVSRPANLVAAVLVALGSGTAGVKGMSNLITRGLKAYGRVQRQVSTSMSKYFCARSAVFDVDVSGHTHICSS